MKHIVHSTQSSMQWQIKPILSFTYTFSDYKWTYKLIPKLAWPMQLQVEHRQQHFGANIKLNVMSTRIGIALLVLLHLQQMLKHERLNILPVLNLVLSSLHRMHAIEAINWHPQALSISQWQASQLHNSVVHNQLNYGQTFNPVPTLVCKCTNNLFDSTILALGLTIGLRIVSATKYGLCTHDALQCFLKCSCETTIMIILFSVFQIN